MFTFTMNKWVIREPAAKTCEGDSGEPCTSASGHLTSENVSATTSATSTTEESNISVGSGRAGKFRSRKKRNIKKPILNMDLLIPLSTASSAHSV
jgi:hypothetical protein